MQRCDLSKTRMQPEAAEASNTSLVVNPSPERSYAADALIAALQLQNSRRILLVNHLAFSGRQPRAVNKLARPFHEARFADEIVRAEHDMVDSHQLARAVERPAIPS